MVKTIKVAVRGGCSGRLSMAADHTFMRNEVTIFELPAYKGEWRGG
jgi:hypothetical protein